ncbi:hypothetical protein T484DRAFT_1802991 [Baffinella frigidus]|nr:hypothetical protein T484DRAFT_1802991 [Cryptophyta sp. CCMP2293]
MPWGVQELRDALFDDSHDSKRDSIPSVVCVRVVEVPAEVEGLPCQTSLRKGDTVWLSTHDARIARRGTFTPAYMGPFAVTLVDEAHTTCRLALPPHSTILDEPFRFDQLRLHCTQADEATPCMTDAFSVLQIMNLPRPQRDAQETFSSISALEHATPLSVLEISGLPRPVNRRVDEHWCDVLDRLERESLERKVVEVQDPDQRVLASFMALLDGNP